MTNQHNYITNKGHNRFLTIKLELQYQIIMLKLRNILLEIVIDEKLTLVAETQNIAKGQLQQKILNT